MSWFSWSRVPSLDFAQIAEMFSQAQAEMEQLAYADALLRLQGLLPQLRADHKPHPYLGPVVAMIGECYFQSDRAADAIGPTREALSLADAEETIALLGNLYEIHRRLGQATEASDCAERLATLHSGELARRYRQQAALVRGGEPLCRVVADIDHERYEIEELLAGVVGSPRFVYERNRITLLPAQAMTQEGVRLMSLGDYVGAEQTFAQAAKRDHYNPEPPYRRALGLLHLDRPEEAQQELANVERLAPGWFDVRFLLWFAGQLHRKVFDHDCYLQTQVLREGALIGPRRRQLLDRTMRYAPDLAILHLLHGEELVAGRLQGEADRAFRKGLACVEDTDTKSRLLLAHARLLEDPTQRRELLQECLRSGGNLEAMATARIVLAFEG